MKYFIDTKYHEYKKKSLFNKSVDIIELISICIVSEYFPITVYDKLAREDVTRDTSREYYAINKDFNLKAAWKNEKVKQNILKPIFWELYKREFNFSRYFTIRNLRILINKYGKTKEEIIQEIIKFTQKNESK